MSDDSDSSIGVIILKGAGAVIGVVMAIAGCVHASGAKPEIVQWLESRGYSQIAISDGVYSRVQPCYKRYSYAVTAVKDDRHVSLKVCDSLYDKSIYDEKHA
ncbi:MAG: hypothetical protein ABIP74_02815 [Candidatus Saccharimonas sp.]